MSVISIEGNIGSGKSELIKNLKEHSHLFSKNIIFLKEPVDAWEDITDENGKKMLAKFYDDQKTYSFSFQMMAYISRLAMLEEVRNNNPDAIIVTERSLYTDKYVFAQMLYDDKMIEEVNMKIYNKWFEHFASKFQSKKIIYVKTCPATCQERITNRGREGEHMALTYLERCDVYHDKMMEHYSDNVMVIDGNQDCFDNKDVLQDWIEEIKNLVEKID